MYMGPDLKAKDILKKLRDAKTARVSQAALDAAKPPSDSAKQVVSGNGEPFEKTGISSVTAKPEPAVSTGASSSATPCAVVIDANHRSEETHSTQTLSESMDKYGDSLREIRIILTEWKDKYGVFSEYGIHLFEAQFRFRTDGSVGIEMSATDTNGKNVEVPNRVRESLETIVSKIKIDKPPEKDVVVPIPIDRIPSFIERNAPLLKNALGSIVVSHNKELLEKGVAQVEIALTFERGKKSVRIDRVYPSGAEQMLRADIEKEIGNFLIRGSIDNPQWTDVKWVYEHAVERTWIGKPKSDGPAPLAVVSPGPLKAVEAAVAAAQSERPVAAKGTIDLAGQSSGTTKIIKIGEDLIIQHKEISRRFAIYDMCRLDANGKPEVIGKIEIPVEKKGGKQIIKDESGKAFEVALRMRENGELEMDENGLEPVLDIAPAPVKQSYKQEVQAVLVGAVATGTFFAILPKAIETLKFYALNIPYVGNFMYSISVPDQVNILGFTVNSTALISGVAVVSGIASAILVGLGIHSKKKQGDKK